MTATHRKRTPSRRTTRETPEGINAFRAQHLTLDLQRIAQENGFADVLVNGSESPLAWLARRKGRDGQAMISPHQFLAGEKLRADFTRGHMAPRVTADWSSAAGGRSGGCGNMAADMTDVMLASRQRVTHAMSATGPEFAGVLMDVCCFLRGLEDVERERGWPSRSAKVVLQLALDRLARHYGLVRETRGPDHSRYRTWLAGDTVSES